jgi:hypothetical protein
MLMALQKKPHVQSFIAHQADASPRSGGDLNTSQKVPDPDW